MYGLQITRLIDDALWLFGTCPKGTRGKPVSHPDKYPAGALCDKVTQSGPNKGKQVQYTTPAYRAKKAKGKERKGKVRAKLKAQRDAYRKKQAAAKAAGKVYGAGRKKKKRKAELIAKGSSSLSLENKEGAALELLGKRYGVAHGQIEKRIKGYGMLELNYKSAQERIHSLEQKLSLAIAVEKATNEENESLRSRKKQSAGEINIPAKGKIVKVDIDLDGNLSRGGVFVARPTLGGRFGIERQYLGASDGVYETRGRKDKQITGTINASVGEHLVLGQDGNYGVYVVKDDGKLDLVGYENDKDTKKEMIAKLREPVEKDESEGTSLPSLVGS